MPLLSCRNIRKIYPDGKEALRGIDLELDCGTYGLLGPNGAGKTTLMEIITLGLEATSGELRLAGIDPGSDPMGARRTLGYLPQHVGFHSQLSALEFLEYVTRLSGVSGRNAKKRAKAILDRVNLGPVANERLHTYSGGMLRRVGIAQALAGDPSILVVDEPTAGLDPEERIRFRNLLFELGRDRLVILSTHIVGDVQETCSELGLLLDGRMVYSGSAQEFITAASGSTWECEGAVDEIDAFAASGRLVQIRETSPGLRFRVIGERPEREMCAPMVPNLEDAYVHFMNQQGVLTASNWGTREA